MRALAILLLAAVPSAAFADAKPPYWATIVPGKARTRSGPGRNYPALWLYQRSGLPVRVVATYPGWRKIVDPDGASGWMQANLLSDKRSAIVTGGERPLFAEPQANARTIWRVAAGSVGALSDCDGEWCRLEVAKRRGWVRKADVWGVGRNETFR